MHNSPAVPEIKSLGHVYRDPDGEARVLPPKVGSFDGSQASTGTQGPGSGTANFNLNAPHRGSSPRGLQTGGANVGLNLNEWEGGNGPARARARAAVP
eukprot:1724715-Rhodomonas_salina.1